jgi:PilZ domain
VSALSIDDESFDSENSKIANIVFGRFMLPDMSEHPCQVKDISGNGASFMSAHVPPPGLAVVAYIEELGRVEGVSGDAIVGGFAVNFTATGARRDRLVSKIEWLQKREIGGAENRRHPRYEPREKVSQITLPDGRVYPCEVIDISVSGAAIKSDVMPSVGTYMMLGRMKGRVVRYLEHGVAIEFVKQLDKQIIQQHIA